MFHIDDVSDSCKCVALDMVAWWLLDLWFDLLFPILFRERHLSRRPNTRVTFSDSFSGFPSRQGSSAPSTPAHDFIAIISYLKWLVSRVPKSFLPQFRILQHWVQDKMDHVSYGRPRSWYRSIYRSMHRSIYRSLLGRYSTDTRPMLDRYSTDTRPILDRYSTNARPRLGWNVAWVSTDASTASRSISIRLIVDVSTDSVGDLSVECR